jgi:hypothetical protein
MRYPARETAGGAHFWRIGRMRPREDPRPALQSASRAKSLRAHPDGKVLITDGPYLETKEHVGGFWVLNAADLDEALA